MLEFSSLLQDRNVQESLFWLALAVIIGGAVIVQSAMKNRRKLRERELDLEAKSEMLRQGLTVDEIERVIEAGHRRKIKS